MSHDFEQRLRDALRPQQAPDGFAARVLARTREERQPPVLRGMWQRLRASLKSLVPGMQPWAAAAAAGCILALVVAGSAWMRQQAREAALEQARREAAAKVIYALQLTSAKTAPARQALQEMGLSKDSARP